MDVAAGTLVLWVGWFYFNGGSAASMYNPRNNSVCKIIMKTLLSALVQVV
jgi:ammonia channel protein AmtB